MSIRRIISLASLIALVSLPACGGDEQKNPSAPSGPTTGFFVLVETSMGDFVIELFPDDAPVTVTNFLRYVSEDYYEGLTIHRVIQDFVIQGGGFTPDMVPRPAHDPIVNEAANGLKNLRGAVAMARTSDPNSARSQFFINLRDNTFLDHRDETIQGYGYAVFGDVIAGMDVVDAISTVATGPQNGFNDVPVTPVVVVRMTQGFVRQSTSVGY